VGILTRSCRVFANGTVAVLLAGCGGSQPPIGAPGAMPESPAITTRAEHAGSWMLPEAKSEDLLYVSNVSTVTVYSYPKGKLVGTLKGFYRPGGECSDKEGDVFIANDDAIIEYKHGAKKPNQTLTFPGYEAGGCAVDPSSGNLAVTWAEGISQFYVAVYQGATGTPTLYSDGQMLFVFCGYDDKGNLYVDGGYGDGDTFSFVELPKGASTFETITLDQSFEHAGAVQWDGKYVAVGDDEAQKVYRFAISGLTGALKGTLDLGDAQSVYQFWIDDKTIVGADDLPSTVWYWPYPAGGTPTKSITKAVFHPIGVTVSKATNT
jgi:hypothetical protein